MVEGALIFGGAFASGFVGALCALSVRDWLKTRARRAAKLASRLSSPPNEV